MQKATKLYSAVQKLDNTSFTRAKSDSERRAEKIGKINEAEDVWKQGGGSANEIAQLYLALVRAAGLKAWPTQVVNRDRAVFDMRYLSVDQLDDFLVIVSIEGKELFLDPGQKMCPFGSLHWKHTLAGGMRNGPKGPAPVTTPAISFKNAGVQRIADLTIDEHDNVTGTLRLIMSGPGALHWRQRSLDTDLTEIKKKFEDDVNSSIPDGVHADFDHFIALDDSSSSLVAVLRMSGNQNAPTANACLCRASSSVPRKAALCE